jgi:cobalt/nickel transport system permease protein
MASGGFLARTVSGITGALEQTIFSEEQARLHGLVQQIDPRVKLLCLLAMIVTAALVRHLPGLIALYAVTIGLAVSSRLAIGPFLMRSLVGATLFSAMVAVPALFIVPGQPLLVVQFPTGFAIAISDHGLASAVMLVARVATSVSLAIVLVLTTRWAQLLRSLESLRVPQAFVVVLGMTYRYLFLILRLANDMFMARSSRSIGQTSGEQDRHWLGSAGGALVGKSMKMSEDVYLAMRARGYSGEVRTIDQFHTRDIDWLFVAMTTVVIAGVLLLDRYLR